MGISVNNWEAAAMGAQTRSSVTLAKIAAGLACAVGVLAVTCKGWAAPGTVPRDTPASMHPEGNPGSEPVKPMTKGHYAASMMLSLDHGPARLLGSDGSLPALIRRRWVADFGFVVGWHSRASVGLALPVLLSQTGDTSQHLTKTGLGDPTLLHKVDLLGNGPLGGFGLSLMNTLSLPVAPPATYLGENSATAGLTVLTELRLMVLVLRARAGVLAREPRTSFGRRLATELPFAASIQLKPQLFGWDRKGRWTLQLHTRAALQTTPGLGAGPFSRVSWGATARADLGDAALVFGAELPLNSGGGVPQSRLLVGFQYTPSSFDLDSDRIVDEDDFCPTEPEDYDGDVDDDGCPETDGPNTLGAH